MIPFLHYRNWLRFMIAYRDFEGTKAQSVAGKGDSIMDGTLMAVQVQAYFSTSGSRDLVHM